MSKLAQQIVKRLVDMGEIDASEYDLETASIDRLRPGHWQRSGGAWSWSLDLKKKDGTFGGVTYGSQWSATECIKADAWDFYATGFDHGIMPCYNDRG